MHCERVFFDIVFISRFQSIYILTEETLFINDFSSSLSNDHYITNKEMRLNAQVSIDWTKLCLVVCFVLFCEFNRSLSWLNMLKNTPNNPLKSMVSDVRLAFCPFLSFSITTQSTYRMKETIQIHLLISQLNHKMLESIYWRA